MIDDLLTLKAAAIEQGAKRVREEYARAPDTSAADLPVKDAAILNSLLACQATPDMGQHVIHRECLGALQSIDDRAPTLERGGHQNAHADYATCIDGQQYRLRNT